MTLLLLCLSAALAGFIDAIVGGGGLIQLPALLILLPQTEIATLFGINKMASACGTTFALKRYSRHLEMAWHSILPAVAAAFLFSYLGAKAVSYLDPKLARPTIVVLLTAVAIYTFARKDLGAIHAPRLSRTASIWIGAAGGAAIGFYDGFFGPGTGSFLILLFIAVFGFDFLNASAAAKAVNLATNVAALAYFILNGYIQFEYALPMAVCNVAGAAAGAHIAIKGGSALVRRLFLGVVSVLIIKLGWGLLHQN